MEESLPECLGRGYIWGAKENEWPPRSRWDAFKIRVRRGMKARARGQHEGGQDKGQVNRSLLFELLSMLPENKGSSPYAGD